MEHPAPLGGAAVNRTPWAVECRHHGLVHLTSHEYNRQVSHPNEPWTCPLCNQEAMLNLAELLAYGRQKKAA